jgi:ubiquinone/menaquinone biosynthesis C-methylase UbiE
VYDTFYADVYDDIFIPLPRIKSLLKTVEQMAPKVEASNMLDIGSGTGMLVNELGKNRYHAYGVDSSKDMIEYSQKKYPEIAIQHGNVMNTILFDSSSFTHIFCTDFTIYHFQDKTLFLKNCFFWLVPRGYLFLHLVNPETFDTVPPVGTLFLVDDAQKYSKDRILETSIEFPEFHYDTRYDVSQISKNSIDFLETFTDKKTKKVRQNERTWCMDSVADIVQLATNIGFHKIDYFSKKDIYVFQR